MYTEAFGYPFEGEHSTERLLIGSAIVLAYGLIYVFALLLSFILIGILLFPLVLIPLILLYGYSMEIFDTTIDDVDTTPPFDDWGALAKQGVRMFGLTFIYQIPMGILVVGYLVLFVGVAAGLDGGGSEQLATQALSGLSIVFVLAFFGLALPIGYVLPASFCGAAAERSITSGFDLERLKGACLSREYAVGWILAVAVLLVLGGIGQLFSLVLVGIPLVFYSQVVASRLVAIGYREALDATENPSSDPAEKAAVDAVGPD